MVRLLAEPKGNINALGDLYFCFVGGRSLVCANIETMGVRAFARRHQLYRDG